jgi:sigma-B regulation protein RsbU (phosphoserine phosphatase)
VTQAVPAAGEEVAILVVDDSSFNRLVLKRRLGELGYDNVTMAEDGVQGLGLAGTRPVRRGPARPRDAEPRRHRRAGAAARSARRGAAGHRHLRADGDGEDRPLHRARRRGLPAEILRPAAAARPPRRHPREEAAARPGRRRLAALEAELESARAAQLSLVPRDFAAAACGRLSVHAAMVPARQVGGDLYDCFRLDARRMLFAVADVSGKGARRG